MKDHIECTFSLDIEIDEYSDIFLAPDGSTVIFIEPVSTQQRRPNPRRVGHSRTNLWPVSSLPSLISISSPRSSFLPSFQVRYLPADKVPDREITTKQAVPRLIDRLARHAMQPARKEGYIKFATIFGHIADTRTSWMVDVFVGSISSISTDYIDKLNWSSLPSLPFLIPSAWLCSTRQFICPLPLMYSSGRPPHPRCQRN